ncbi:MAG TPA: BlaI/MecI/CopY family transcriptional regulator [Pirellulales bacterium]|nr:BlaI/MecI/CopY family transcriptional regulator [Pirellulales bacterium]
MARPASEQPTDGELEILSVLWETGPAELRIVHSALCVRRKVATTTVATMLGVMLEKGLVRRTNGARGYSWSAAVSRDEAANGLVGKLVDRLFDGSASRLMAHLVARGQLTAAQRRELQQLLTAAESPKPKRGDKSS